MKIKNKLTLLFTLIVAAILVSFGCAIFFTYSFLREIEFYNRLKDKAYKTAELLYDVKEINSNILQIVDKHDITTLHEEEVIIYDTTFKQIYKSGEEYIHLPEKVLKKITIKKEIKLIDGDRETVGVKAKTKHGNVYIIASAVDYWGLQKARNLLIILIVGGMISVVIVYFAGLSFATNALAPISIVVSEVGAITASNLNLRLNEGNKQDELAQLSITFNKMLSRLEESFEMQRNFVSNASHEFRTPLTAIKGQIEVALLSERSIEEYKATMQSINEDISYLTAIVNGLLELAKVSSDESAFKLDYVRIDELIWQCRSDVMKKQPEYNVKVAFQNFPEDDDDTLIVSANESLLKTAFTNLIDNACKFSENHTVEILIVILKEEIKVLFMDTGAGIPAEDLPFIFQPFYRSRASKRTTGYGIGLSLVEKIVKLHKGNIEVNSTSGVGSIFTISIPHRRKLVS
ncbi:MAG: HAMP domain-containing sensor histidine kinase [Bacteroidota bacterium]|nr:HAMP domain-containing sensor histidine kinase [Bacteroidota bacterium]